MLGHEEGEAGPRGADQRVEQNVHPRMVIKRGTPVNGAGGDEA